MKQEFCKTSLLRSNTKVTKMLTINFKRTMIVDAMNRETKIMTT